MSSRKSDTKHRPDKRKFDGLDKEILIRLQVDARKSYREIATDLGISVGTVHNRIKKLIKSEILIGFQPILDSKMLGYDLCFLVLMAIRGGHAPDVLAEIKHNPNVRAVYHTTGAQSAALICRFKRLEDARDFISEINENQFVEKTVSNLVLDVIKEDMNIDLHTFDTK